MGNPEEMIQYSEEFPTPKEANFNSRYNIQKNDTQK